MFTKRTTYLLVTPNFVGHLMILPQVSPSAHCSSHENDLQEISVYYLKAPKITSVLMTGQ